MHHEDTSKKPAEQLELEYIGNPVSSVSGCVVKMRYFEELCVRVLLQHALPDGQKSSNHVPVMGIVMVLVSANLARRPRFAHIKQLRADEVHGISDEKWSS